MQTTDQTTSANSDKTRTVQLAAWTGERWWERISGIWAMIKWKRRGPWLREGASSGRVPRPPEAKTHIPATLEIDGPSSCLGGPQATSHRPRSGVQCLPHPQNRWNPVWGGWQRTLARNLEPPNDSAIPFVLCPKRPNLLGTSEPAANTMSSHQHDRRHMQHLTTSLQAWLSGRPRMYGAQYVSVPTGMCSSHVLPYPSD